MNVNFPTESPQFVNTGEGGMGVRIVVAYPPHAKPHWPNPVQWNCNLSGLHPEPPGPNWNRKVETHFPTLSDDDSPLGPWRSINYAAVVTLEETNWSGYSGYDTDDPQPWTCTYSDLTQTGRDLHHALARAFPGHPITIQTWLCT